MDTKWVWIQIQTPFHASSMA